MASSLIPPSSISFNLPSIQKNPRQSKTLHLPPWDAKLLPLRSSRNNYGLLLCRSAQSYSVEIEHEGIKHTLQVGEDETILSKALDAGIDVPHDCKLGVCMTCPARLVSGEVEQSEGMLSDDVVDKGYALMCASYPRSDCSIRTIPEDELLSLQLVTASD